MTSPAAITNSVIGIASDKYAAAPVVSDILKIFLFIRKIWNLNRKREIYLNTNNWTNLCLGQALNYVAGEREVIKIAAHCMYTTRCILATGGQFIKVGRAWSRVANAVEEKFPRSVRKESSRSSLLIASSTKNRFCNVGKLLKNRVVRIAVAIVFLVKEIFVLSMMVIDTVDSFYFNPKNNKERVREMFVNASECIDYLVDNQNFLLECLTRHRTMIETVVSDITGNTFKADNLIKVVSRNVSATKKVKKVMSFANNTIQKFVQEMIYWGAYNFGLEQRLPKGFLPAEEKPWLSNSDKGSSETVKKKSIPRTLRIRKKHAPSPAKIELQAIGRPKEINPIKV